MRSKLTAGKLHAVCSRFSRCTVVIGSKGVGTEVGGVMVVSISSSTNALDLILSIYFPTSVQTFFCEFSG